MAHHHITLSTLVLEFLRMHPHILALYIVSLAVMPIQEILLPITYGHVVKAITERKDLVAPFIKVVIVITIIQLGYFFQDWMEVHIFPMMGNFFRKRMITHILDSNESAYNEQKTGSIIAKLVKLPSTFFSYLEAVRVYIIPQIVVFVLAIVYLWYHDWMLGGSLFLVVLCVLSFVLFAPQWCLPLASQRDMVFNDMHEEIDDVLRNMLSVYNSGQRSAEDERLDTFEDKFVQLNKQSIWCGLQYKAVLVPVQICFMMFFMWRCYNLVKRRRMETGRFVSLFMTVLYLNGSVMRMIAQIKELVMKNGIMDQGIQMFENDIGEGSVDGKATRHCNNGRERIENTEKNILSIRNVSFAYPLTTVNTVSNFSMDIADGERVLLTGRIGAGKSSILKLLMKYNTPNQGEIYYKGIPYCSLTADYIRKEFGFVAQHPILFNRSIYDNIVYGTSPPKSRADILEMLHALGLESMFATFPQGIDGLVGKNGSYLSGGQRQVCMILRVMLQNPSVILLDEPTASIDEGTKDMVYNLLTVMIKSKKRTVIMVSHDEFLNKFADRIIHVVG